MKNKIPKESITKKKGFYMALYTTLGVALIGVAVYSLTSVSPQQEILISDDIQAEIDFGDLRSTNQSNTRSYLTPEDRGNETASNESTSDLIEELMGQVTASENVQSRNAVGPTAKPTETEQPETPKPEAAKPAEATKAPEVTKAPERTESSTNESTMNEVSTEEIAEIATEETSSTVSSSERSEEANTTQQQATEIADDIRSSDSNINIDRMPQSVDLPQIQSVAPINEPSRDPVFASNYDENSKMLWPVIGEIVMDFSPETLIFDKTLEQFRTNNDVKISAEVGTQVRAAADGKVIKITQSREKGNTVEIEHGNGWVTTYSQLQDGVLVKAGDVVREGQVIGGVSSPTIYSVLLGNHLSFAVTNGNNYVDPKSVFRSVSN